MQSGAACCARFECFMSRLRVACVCLLYVKTFTIYLRIVFNAQKALLPFLWYGMVEDPPCAGGQPLACTPLPAHMYMRITLMHTRDRDLAYPPVEALPRVMRRGREPRHSVISRAAA